MIFKQITIKIRNVQLPILFSGWKCFAVCTPKNIHQSTIKIYIKKEIIFCCIFFYVYIHIYFSTPIFFS